LGQYFQTVEGGIKKQRIRKLGSRLNNAPESTPAANFKEESGNLANIDKIGFIRENGI